MGRRNVERGAWSGPVLHGQQRSSRCELGGGWFNRCRGGSLRREWDGRQLAVRPCWEKKVTMVVAGAQVPTFMGFWITTR